MDFSEEPDAALVPAIGLTAIIAVIIMAVIWYSSDKRGTSDPEPTKSEIEYQCKKAE